MKRRLGNAMLAVAVAAMAVAGCSRQSPEEQLASARAYVAKGDPKAAAIQVKNVLQVEPDSAEARHLLGQILLSQGDPRAAEIELRKAQSLQLPAAQVVPELAQAMLLTGQFNPIVSEFAGTTLDLPLADASLQTTLSTAYATLGKKDAARAALTKALATQPGYGPALLASARQKAASQDNDAALADIDTVLTRDAADKEAWKLKGDVLLIGKNDSVAALAAYQKAVALDPGSQAAQTAILAVLVQQKRFDDALAQMEKLKKISSGVDTKFLEAQLAYDRGDFKLAKSLSRDLLARAPSNASVLQLAGAVEFQMKSFGQAESYLSNALQAAPNLTMASRLLVDVFLRTGRPQKALDVLNKLGEKGDLDPGMYALAGEVYLQNGDPKRAEAFLTKALALDPGSPKLRTSMAISHLAAGQGDAAFAELRAVANADPGTTADLALISVNLARGQYDQALVAVADLDRKQPGQPLAPSLRGQIEAARNDKVAARRSFEEALKADPSYFAAASGLAALDMSEKKPADAKKRFEDLVTRNPNNESALLALAQLAIAERAPETDVQARFVKAIAAAPDDAMPRVLQVEHLLAVKDAKQALQAAQAGVAALGDSPEMLTALGRAQQASGDLNQAIVSFEKLAAQQPLSAGPHLLLAQAYMAAKNDESAAKNYRDSLDIQHDLLEAQRGLIALAVRAKRYREATDLALQIQKQRSSEPIGYILAGDIAAASGSPEQAIAAYRVGLDRITDSDLAVRLHSTLTSQGRGAESARFATGWLKDHPDDANFLFYAGTASIARKDYKTAESQLASLLKLQPDSPLALNNLAWVKGQLGDQDALGLAMKAVDLAPNQPQFLDTLALLQAASRDFGKAIAAQNKALALEPDNPELRFHLAKILVMSGDRREARTELEALTKLGDKYGRQSDVMALLKTL